MLYTRGCRDALFLTALSVQRRLHSTEYVLWVGRSPDSNDIYDSGTTRDLAATVRGLPTDGSPVYVRLSSKIGEDWLAVQDIFDGAAN